MNKVPNKRVFSKIHNGIVFGNAREFDALCYITNLESCDKVFDNGLTLNTSKEYLWLTNEFNIDDGGALPVRPIKLSDHVEDVMFAFNGMKFLALRKFYYLEILDYGEISVLKILVTHKAYSGLKKFNPFLETKAPSKTGTLPLVYFKRSWVQYTTVSTIHGKKTEMQIELLLDSIPAQNVILCDYMLKDQTDDLIPLFLFFANLSKYQGKNGIVYRGGEKSSLHKVITSIHRCHCDTEVVHTLPYMDRIGCVNNALLNINFARAFDTGCIQQTDIMHVNAMDLIFLKTQAVPYPEIMVAAITNGITGMEKKMKCFESVFSVFLQHFLTHEAKLTVKTNLIVHLSSL